MRMRNQLILFGLVGIVSIGVALIFLSSHFLGDVDWDVAYLWESGLTGWPKVAAHHRFLSIIYGIGLHSGVTPLSFMRLLFGSAFFFMAMSACLLSGHFHQGFFPRFAFSISSTLCVPLLSHLSSFEDNLLGFPLCAIALSFFLKFSKSRQLRDLFLTCLFGALTLCMGYTYIAWIGGLFGATFLIFLTGFLPTIQSFKNSAIYLIVCTIMCVFIYGLCDLIDGKTFLSSVGLFIEQLNPYNNYKGIIRPFTIDGMGISYSLHSLLSALTGINRFFLAEHAKLADRISLLLFLFLIGLLIRSVRVASNRPIAALLIFVALFQMAYLATSMERDFLERMDWLCIWIPVSLSIIIPKRAAIPLVAWVLASVAAFGVQSYDAGQLGRMVRIANANETVILDQTYFLRPGDVNDTDMSR